METITKCDRRDSRDVGLEAAIVGRGALQRRGRRAPRHAGAAGKANVGISNDKGCEKHPRRKTKVS